LSRFRVVITDFAAQGHGIETEVFARSGLDIELVGAQVSRDLGLAAATAGAHALLVQFATIDAALIATLHDCRVISRYGVGVDMVDLEAAGEAGIPVSNVPDFCVDEVSTQTVGFIVDLNRRTIQLDRHVHEKRWGTAPPVTAPHRLSSQTLGVVGLGAIGREVARKAQALGLSILAHDPFAVPGTASGVELVALPELLTRSDFVTLHCPLNASTQGLIGSAELASMKPTAYLLNLSRGPVVDQAALVQAIGSGRLAGAALDVLEAEPPDPDDPLLALDNVIITPHSSSWSVESALQLRRDAAQNVVTALSGGVPRSIVNGPQLRHCRSSQTNRGRHPA
jgi:D-3-phosphoglycerate dehydrogenase / 2-oxoglutarate reductase